MFKEVDRPVPVAIYPIAEVSGAADADRALAEPKRLEAAQRLNATVERTTERFLKASMQYRCVKVVEWAIAQLKPDADAEQINYLNNHIQSFETFGAEFCERCDLFGLNGAISAFQDAVTALPKAAPPKPPLMPTGDTVFYFAGWSSEEELGLRNILLKGLCEVKIGDRCISIDEHEAKLASGKRISKKEAGEAGPSLGTKMIAVGSLPVVMAAIRARS